MLRRVLRTATALAFAGVLPAADIAPVKPANPGLSPTKPPTVKVEKTPFRLDVALKGVFEPAATADLSGAKLERTYTGPRRIQPAGMHFVREIVKTGDFEAVLTWAIGLSERRPFMVTSSGSPPRLTIELG